MCQHHSIQRGFVFLRMQSLSVSRPLHARPVLFSALFIKIVDTSNVRVSYTFTLNVSHNNINFCRGECRLVRRHAHNVKHGGSNPSPATNFLWSAIATQPVCLSMLPQPDIPNTRNASAQPFAGIVRGVATTSRKSGEAAAVRKPAGESCHVRGIALALTPTFYGRMVKSGITIYPGGVYYCPFKSGSCLPLQLPTLCTAAWHPCNSDISELLPLGLTAPMIKADRLQC